jgi:hypothetical protein
VSAMPPESGSKIRGISDTALGHCGLMMRS